jgi:hypothetical protein
VQEDAVAYIGGAEWRGDWVMRVSVTSGATTVDEGRIAADAVIAAWRKVRDNGGQ